MFAMRCRSAGGGTMKQAKWLAMDASTCFAM
jgi:hypothetical protein